MTHRHRAIALAFIGIALAPLTSAMAETRSFRKSFPMDAEGTLAISSDTGEIQVDGKEGSEVAIVATIEGDRRAVEAFAISADASEGVVRVTGEAVESGGWHRDRHDLKVTYSIQVPRDIDIKISTAGGDIELSDVRGNMEVQTAGGDVLLRRVDGDVRAGTSGGEVRAESVNGSVRGRSSGGDVVFIDVSGDAEARTSGGDIRISRAGGRVQAMTSGGDIGISLAGTNRGIVARTSGGDIEVHLPPAEKADIDVATSGGSIRVALPLTVQGTSDDDQVTGLLNGGGPAIRARTSGGSILIRARDAVQVP